LVITEGNRSIWELLPDPKEKRKDGHMRDCKGLQASVRKGGGAPLVKQNRGV